MPPVGQTWKISDTAAWEMWPEDRDQNTERASSRYESKQCWAQHLYLKLDLFCFEVGILMPNIMHLREDYVK